MIKGLLLLREYYKTEYKKALQDKIEKQKKTFQQRQAYLEEEAKLSQELEVIKCNVQVISKRLPPVLCIFPLEINIKRKTSDEGKLLLCSKRCGTKFLISFQDRLYLMIANSRVEYKLT